MRDCKFNFKSIIFGGQIKSLDIKKITFNSHVISIQFHHLKLIVHTVLKQHFFLSGKI